MIPFTAYGVFSWRPLRVSFGGAVGVGFGVVLGVGDAEAVAVVGVDGVDGVVWTTLAGAGTEVCGVGWTLHPPSQRPVVSVTTTRTFVYLTGDGCPGLPTPLQRGFPTVGPGPSAQQHGPGPSAHAGRA